MLMCLINYLSLSDVISEFPFLLPKNGSSATFDEDDDLDIERPQKEVIQIGMIYLLQANWTPALIVSVYNILNAKT